MLVTRRIKNVSLQFDLGFQMFLCRIVSYSRTVPKQPDLISSCSHSAHETANGPVVRGMDKFIFNTSVMDVVNLLQRKQGSGR